MEEFLAYHYCPLCQQSFHSEKGLYRHTISRKHQKRQHVYERYMAWKAAITNTTKLPPLPNSLIQALIDDLHLTNETRKEDFFANIALVDVQEFDRSIIKCTHDYRPPFNRFNHSWNNGQYLQSIAANQNVYTTRFSPLYRSHPYVRQPNNHLHYNFYRF